MKALGNNPPTLPPNGPPDDRWSLAHGRERLSEAARKSAASEASRGHRLLVEGVAHRKLRFQMIFSLYKTARPAWRRKRPDENPRANRSERTGALARFGRVGWHSARAPKRPRFGR